MAKYKIKMNYVPKFRWSTCLSKLSIHSELFFDDYIWYDEEYQRITIRAYNVKIKRCKKCNDRMFIITANFKCPEEHFSTYELEVIDHLYDFTNIEIKEIKKPYKNLSKTLNNLV